MKRYNAEIHSQTAIEAAISLQQSHGFQASEIESVDVDVFDVAHRTIGGGEEGDKTLVFTKEDADHSLPYLIAVALLDHEVMPDQFTEERIKRADVQSLLCRVSVHPVPDYSRRFPGEMPSRVTVTLTDRRVFTRALLDYRGFRSRPQTWDDAIEKFTVLSSRNASEKVISSIANAVHHIENKRVVELTRLLRDLGAPANADAREAA